MWLEVLEMLLKVSYVYLLGTMTIHFIVGVLVGDIDLLKRALVCVTLLLVITVILMDIAMIEAGDHSALDTKDAPKRVTLFGVLFTFLVQKIRELEHDNLQ